MTAPRFQSISPFLAANELAASVAFYRQQLGFALAWEWGCPADMAAVCRDDVEIALTSRSDAKPTGISRLYIRVEAIDSYYAQLQQAGVVIEVPIDDRPYGMRDFSIVDPAGNVLCFGQPLPQPQPAC